MTKLSQSEIEDMGSGFVSIKRSALERMRSELEAERLMKVAAEAERKATYERQTAKWKKWWVNFGIPTTMIFIAYLTAKIFT